MALVERPTALLSGLALHPEDLLVRLALELADLLCVAGVKRPTPGEARFWGLAEPLLEEPGITRSTMMGSRACASTGNSSRRVTTVVVPSW